MRASLTRRALLGQIAGAAAWAQTGESDPLRQLRAGHPRLLLPDSELDRVRATVKENAVAKRLFMDLEKECDRLLSIPPVEYRLTGTRLQTQTRRAVDRITTLALMYRLTGRDPWLRRAIMELNAAASFRDWNPARYVDTAEMMYAFAIGYDWLYNALSAEERAWVREALVTKGLDTALPVYQQKTWWTRQTFHWNVVCNGAVAMAALAVADEAHDKAAELLRGVYESIPHGLATFGVDGGWPEGPAFGEYALRYACLFFASLDTALGSDLAPGGARPLERACRYRMYSTGPANRSFNFGDATDEAGVAPEMFWIAKRYNVPAYAWCEQRAVEKNMHADAVDLAWFQRDAKPPAPPAWPLDAVLHGMQVATFRSSWEDPAAIFLAVKGGDNKAPHSHLDLGSFVLDAGGVRWAADLGPEEIPVPGPPRTAFYRVRTESHNTLLIDGENQDAKAEARIVRQETTPDLSWVQLDLSKSTAKTKLWLRRVGMAQRQAVLIEDTLRTDMPVEAIWSMMTDADITVNGASATLHKGGWNLLAEIRTPRHAVFDIAPLRVPAGQTPNPKFQRLIVRFPEKVTELDLNVVLTPYKDGATRAKIAAQFPV